MSHLTKAAALLLLTLLSGLPLYAQELQKASPNDNPAESSAESRALQNQQRALALLDQLLETSTSFEDAYLKIKIKAEIADLLWPRDNPRARQMFEAAFRDLDGMKMPNLEADASLPSSTIAGIKSRFRTEILTMISRRDQAWAETLAKSIEPAPPIKPESPACTGCLTSNESNTQQLQLALRTLDTAPERAVQMAKEALSKGLNPMIKLVLYVMQSKDAALADELFLYALSVAHRQGPSISESYLLLVSHVFPEFGSGMWKYLGGTPRPTAPANPALIAEFLNSVHDAVVREADALQSREANAAAPLTNQRIALDYFFGQQTLPYFDRYMPDKTAAVHARLEDIIRIVPPDTARQYLADFNRERTPEALSNEAETETRAEMQQSLYQQAIMQAMSKQDFDQALALVLKLDDETARFYFESRARFQRTQAAMNKRDLDLAYEYANAVPDLSMRGSLLGRIALQWFYDKDPQRAAQMLAEAEALFPKAESSVEKAKEMLDLVYASAQIDRGRGFADMQSAIEAINAAGFAPQWIRFKDLISQKTGKRFMGTEVGIGTLRFETTLGVLARSDFERSLKFAQMIGLKEISVLAQLAVCRIAINEMPAAQNAAGQSKGNEKLQRPVTNKSPR